MDGTNIWTGLYMHVNHKFVCKDMYALQVEDDLCLNLGKVVQHRQCDAGDGPGVEPAGSRTRDLKGLCKEGNQG